jgi:hypothetical protein
LRPTIGLILKRPARLTWCTRSMCRGRVDHRNTALARIVRIDVLLNPSAPFGCSTRRSQIAIEPPDVSLPAIAARPLVNPASMDGAARVNVRVKLRRTQCEQMSSGLPLKADIAQGSRHVSKVPNSEVTGYQFAFSTRYAAERSFPTVSGRPNCSQTSRSAAASNQNTGAVIIRASVCIFIGPAR